jgi:hypothetical protein
MSRASRSPVRIGRVERALRDDRVFYVATEDTYAPKQYFDGLSLRRLKVVVLPTPEGSGLSAPSHVVERLFEHFRNAKLAGDVQDDDEFWVLMDTDHHVSENHKTSFIRALDSARQSGFRIAISNPSFEIWLLLHHSDLDGAVSFGSSTSVETQLTAILGSYDKSKLDATRFPIAKIPAAIRRARALEASPDHPKSYWPEKPGTRVYLLLEALGFGAQE